MSLSVTLCGSTHLLVAPLALTSHTDASHLAPFPSPQVSFCLSKFLPISSPSSPPTSPMVSPGACMGWGKDGLVLQSPTGGCESNSADVPPVMRSSVNAFSPHRNQQPQNYCVLFFFIALTLHFEEVVMRLAPLIALQYTFLSGCIYRTGFLTA